MTERQLLRFDTHRFASGPMRNFVAINDAISFPQLLPQQRARASSDA